VRTIATVVAAVVNSSGTELLAGQLRTLLRLGMASMKL